jgi:hypothetical protein
MVLTAFGKSLSSAILIVHSLSFIRVALSMGSCAGFVRPNTSAFPYGIKLTPSPSVYSWDGASVGCQLLHPDAKFAFLRDKDAMLQAFAQLTGFIYVNTWVAMKQYNSSGDIKDGWFWTDGVPGVGNETYQRYLLWANGEPNVPAGDARCVSLWHGIQGDAMSDDACYNTFPVVCEVHGKFGLEIT